MSVASRLWLRRLSAAAIVALLAIMAVIVGGRLRELRAPVASVDTDEVTSGMGDRAVGVYTGFEFVERVAGLKVFELMSKRTLGLSSGWHEIEGVRLQFFKGGEPGPILTCDGASFNIQTRDARLEGGVRIELPSGAILTTDAGSFESGSRRFTANAEVLFVSGATFGRAQSATYDLERDEIVLDRGVTLVAEDGTTLVAETAIYERTSSTVVFPDGGKVSFDVSDVEAPLIRLELEEDDGPPRRIELLGGVTVKGLAGDEGGYEAWVGTAIATNDGQGMWQLEASTTGPWIRVRFVRGDGYFERELKTWLLRASMGSEGLINMRAEQGVCIREVPNEGPVRYGEAGTARVWFDGGQATDIELVGNVILQGGEVEGRGYRARMSPTAGLTMVHGDPTGPERVLLLSERGRMSCDQAQLFNREGRSEARGNVQGVIYDVSLMGSSENDIDEPAHFAAETLDVEEDGAVYHLRENTRLWQGHRLLLADDVVYRHDAAAVRAAGHVRTTFPASQLELEGDPGEDVVVVSRSLEYDQGSGAAIYRGNVRYSDPKHTLAAAELSVFFNQENDVTAIEAVGAVELVILETGRKMTGQIARREVATQLVTITGSPVRVSDPTGNVVSGSSLTWNQADGTVSVAGGTETIYYPEEECPLSPKALDLVAHGLRKAYRGRWVVDGVNIGISPGEIVGLLGPNGAGKTTTFYMMVGLVQPNEGKVVLGDREITSEPMYRRARMGVAYLAQEPSSFKRLSVEDNIWLILEALGVEARNAHTRIDSLLEDFGLSDLRRQRAETLSGGERRRLEVARAIATEPTFILLDEPFAGIDPLAVLDLQRIIKRLKSLGIGVLITDHNVRETLKITDRAYIIKDGKIFATGDPVDLSENQDVRRIYLGEEFRL